MKKILIFILFILLVIIFSNYNNREKNYQSIMSDKLITNRITSTKIERKIPKNIVQSLNSRKVTKNLYNNIERIHNLNPDYNYEFFTEKESIEFINKYYGQDYVKAYVKLYNGAFRADFFRYCYLYEKGGIWIDVFMNLEKSLDSIIDKDYNFIVCLDLLDKNNIENHHSLIYKYLIKYVLKNKKIPSQSRIYNAFLAFEPKNALLKEVLEKSYQNIVNNKEDDLRVTGPELFGDVWDNHNLVNYNYKTVNFTLENMIMKYIKGEDLKLDNGIYDKKNKIITNKYPGHDLDKKLINNKNRDGAVYNKNKIFLEKFITYNKYFTNNYQNNKDNIIYELEENDLKNLLDKEINNEKNNIIFDNFSNNNLLLDYYEKLEKKGFLIYINSFKIKDDDKIKDFYYKELVNNNTFELIK